MAHRRTVLGRGLAAGGGIALMTAVTVPAGARDADAPAALAERFAATLTAHDMAAFGALFADDYVNHQASAAAPAPTGMTPKEASVAFFAARLAALPDLSVAIEAIVADGNRVAASFAYSGTHRAPYFGVAPTGKTLRFTSCDIFEVRGGKLAEHWGMGDIAGVLAQLRS